jgi:hypothetical protein
MTVTIGSGLGGFAAVVAQPTYGASMVTPTRPLTLKSAKPTHNPHIVQGGPYLRGGTTIVDLGSAHVQTYLDSTGTIESDMVNTGEALLLATAFGSSGTLTAIGTTAAMQLGGASGISLGAPDKLNGGASGCQFDMQLAVPDTAGLLHQYNYHSCMISKAEWVFDRVGLVTKSYDWDAATVEETTALIALPSFPGAPVPFSMGAATAVFQIGAKGSEAAVDGCRKATFTIQRKLATDRVYLGGAVKEIPVTNGLVDLTIALDFDYTSQARTVMETFLSNTAQSIICKAVGNQIGSSGQFDTFGLQATNAFIQTGGEGPLAGADLVKNTVTFKGTVDTAADSPLIATLITADTTF